MKSIQQTDVSTGPFKMRILRLRQAVAARWISSTARAIAALPLHSHFVFFERLGPLMQSVTGSVANSDQNSFHSSPRLKPNIFLYQERSRSEERRVGKESTS